MFNFKKELNYFDLILLVVIVVIPDLFFTSCSKDLNTPESSNIKISNLYKSDLDADIESIEQYIVQENVDGEIEIPLRFITSQSLSHILFVIDEGEELWLNTKVVEILEMNGEIAITNGVEVGTVLLVNPMPTIRELFDIDSENLRYKFRMGRNYCR